MRGSRVSWGRKFVSGGNHSLGIWGGLWFSCGAVKGGKDSNYVFQHFFATIGGAFIFSWRGDWALA